jgi:hypothetical protein
VDSGFEVERGISDGKIGGRVADRLQVIEMTVGMAGFPPVSRKRPAISG